MHITGLEAYAMMKTSGGRFFATEFIKKDGTRRIIVSRQGVNKGLKGGSLPYNPLEKLLLPAFDIKKQAWRMINLRTMRALAIKGRKYRIYKQF